MSAILSYMWMSSAVSCSWDGCSSDDCSETEFDSMLFCRDMVNRDAPPNGVSFCHHSSSCIDTGAITAGERSRLSPNHPTNEMTARANISVGYPDPQCAALALNSRYYTAPRMSVPDLRRFLKSSFDDPESCNCCDIHAGYLQTFTVHDQKQNRGRAISWVVSLSCRFLLTPFKPAL